MDKELNDRFEQIKLPPEVIFMFVAILEKDDLHRKVLRFIAQKQAVKENVSILNLIENIKTDRRVKVQHKKSFQFEVKEMLIDRKFAERIVDKLSNMSLIYHEYMAPYKLLFLTHRGIEVLQQLEQNRQKNINRKEDKNG